jgi:predicted RNA-binding Zn-ribbon protein involved in translation (DUF1610 family)
LLRYLNPLRQSHSCGRFAGLNWDWPCLHHPKELQLTCHELERTTAAIADATKFTCPDCGQNAWAKADALLRCGNFYEGRGKTIHTPMFDQEGILSIC